MPCLAHSSMKPSASSVWNAAKTFCVGWALMLATTLLQSPPLGTALRSVALPPFLARPASNASADSVPNVSSTRHTKKSLSPLRDVHSPRGSLSCHAVADVLNTYLLLQLGLQSPIERVSELALALVSM